MNGILRTLTEHDICYISSLILDFGRVCNRFQGWCQHHVDCWEDAGIGVILLDVVYSCRIFVVRKRGNRRSHTDGEKNIKEKTDSGIQVETRTALSENLETLQESNICTTAARFEMFATHNIKFGPVQASSFYFLSDAITSIMKVVLLTCSFMLRTPRIPFWSSIGTYKYKCAHC